MKALRTPATKEVYPSGEVTDPFNLRYRTLPSDRGLREVLNRLWKSGPACSFTAPTNIVVFIDRAEDDEDSCALEEPKEPKFVFDIENVVPTDCTTQRKFHQMATELRETTTTLFDELMNLVRPCRSVTAVIKAVPQLEEYLVPAEGSAAHATTLLDNARG